MTNKKKELEEGLNKLSKSMREIYNSSDDTFKFVTDSIRKELIEEFEKMIDTFEKENSIPIKTEDIVKNKIIIADYIKWDKFREIKQQLQELKEKQ